MNNVLEDSLFVSQNKKFDEIQSIIKDNSLCCYTELCQKEIARERICCPIHDDEYGR